MNTQATASEIDRFLADNSFSGYQAVPLPHGRQIPGRDRSPAIRQLLESVDLSGKSVLDVGTYYGALPAIAADLGGRAVGLEPDEERYAIAAQAATLAGDAWSVRAGSLESLEPNERFDVVLLLNVIHHVDEPIGFLRQLAAHCSETLIVEFPMAHDPASIRYLWDDIDAADERSSLYSLARVRFWSIAVRAVSKRIPVAVLGNVPYHRRWHYSMEAFRIIAEQMVDGTEEVAIAQSSWNPNRAVARIEMNRTGK